MIKNFEQYTHEMTSEEKDIIFPRLIRILSICIGKEKAISNKEITEQINNINPIYCARIEDGIDKVRQIKTSGPRIRHMIHIIRITDTIPYLVATSKGYHISNDMEEVLDYIESLEDRVESIYKVLAALKRQRKNYDIDKQPIQGKLIM